MSDKLIYRDSDGLYTEIKNCSLYQDKVGRWWLWSDELQINLAYKIKDKEDCLLSAIASLLFKIQLRDKRISELQRIVDLAQNLQTR